MELLVIGSIVYLVIVLLIWAFFYGASPRRHKSSFDLQWKDRNPSTQRRKVKP